MKGDILQSGDVAKLLGCCHVTVCRLMDLGKIKGWRLPPTGKSTKTKRRFRLKDVIRFMKENGIEVPDWLIEGNGDG